MAGVAAHKCKDGTPPDVATCGTCARSWCWDCYPTPASLCPFCNGDEAGVRFARAVIPPRQVRALIVEV